MKSRPKQTDDLIVELAGEAGPVARLASPHWRMLVWFFVSLLYAGVVIAVVGLRPDITTRLSEAGFLMEVTAALMTSMLAAAAALCAGCPGRPLWERFAPVPAFAIWFGLLLFGCWKLWVDQGSGAISLTPDPVCFLCIFLIGLLPGAFIVAMIQKGAPIAPVATLALGALAASALGAAVLRLLYVEQSGPIVLTSHFGSAVLFTLAGAAAGRYFLRWPDEVY